MVNFYELLQISHNASDEEIKKAYKAQLMVHHPDKNGNTPPSAEMSKLLAMAKDTLGDPAKRLEHDYALGIKQRPVTPPEVIRVPVREVKKETNVGLVLGVAAGAFLLGGLLGGLFDE